MVKAKLPTTTNAEFVNAFERYYVRKALEAAVDASLHFAFERYGIDAVRADIEDGLPRCKAAVKAMLTAQTDLAAQPEHKPFLPPTDEETAAVRAAALAAWDAAGNEGEGDAASPSGPTGRPDLDALIAKGQQPAAAGETGSVFFRAHEPKGEG